MSPPHLIDSIFSIFQRGQLNSLRLENSRWVGWTTKFVILPIILSYSRSPNVMIIHPIRKNISIYGRLYFSRMAIILSSVIYTLLPNPIMGWLIFPPLLNLVGPVTVLTNRIWHKCRSNMVPFLGAYFHWPGSFCFLPLGRHLCLPHLESRHHSVESSNPMERPCVGSQKPRWAPSQHSTSTASHMSSILNIQPHRAFRSLTETT